MRPRVLVLVVAIMASVAMTPAQEVTPDRCDIVLKYWQQVMTSVPAFEADCKRTVSSRRFGTAEVYEGKYRYLKAPAVYASVELHPAGVAKPCVKLILNDAGVYDFQYDAKQLNVSELPKEQRGPGSNPLSLLFNPVPFEFSFARLLFGELKLEKLNPRYTELTLFGARMSEAKKRFEISLVGEDEHYFYLEVKPRSSKDEANFRVGRLTLLKTTYLRAQIWFQQANQDEVSWMFTSVNPVAKHLQPADFATPTPAGWKKIVLPLSGVPLAP